MYRCEDCGLLFETPHTVAEVLSKLLPPFERIAVCPDCKGTNFSEHNPNIPKITVAERLLEALADLHRYQNALKELYGEDCGNKELDEAVGNITELILEMFPFTDAKTDKLIYSVCSFDSAKGILKALEG